MPVFYLDAVSRYRADSHTAISQLTNYISSSPLSKQLSHQVFSEKWEALAIAHSKRLASIAEAAKPKADDTFGTGHLCATLRKLVPSDTIFAIEAVTNTVFVSDNIQPTLPGTWINCGGGGLGWSGGGTLGIKLASEYENGEGKGKFVVQIVGDGTFLFSVPGSVYWISQRYKIPVLTIVLNNKGMNNNPATFHISGLHIDFHQAGTHPRNRFSLFTPMVSGPKRLTKNLISLSLLSQTTQASPRQPQEGTCLRRR